jgi:hypothetical protein
MKDVHWRTGSLYSCANCGKAEYSVVHFGGGNGEFYILPAGWMTGIMLHPTGTERIYVCSQACRIEFTNKED